MKNMWFFLVAALFIIPANTKASNFKIGKEVTINAATKMTTNKKRIVRKTYWFTKNKLISYLDIDTKFCKFNHLEVNIVKNVAELEDPKKFNVAKANKAKDEIIFGWYIRGSSKIYIMPMNLNKRYLVRGKFFEWQNPIDEYGWQANFAHEIIHYIFDSCDIIVSDFEEHGIIEDFLETHKNQLDKIR